MLEVISAHKSSMGENARRVIDESEAAEFTIGRLETCSWVLPQDYVSRVLAIVRCVNNMYFLERKGNTPLAINDRSRPIERNRVVRIAPGDLLLVDDIEIQTSEVEPGYVPPRPEASPVREPDLTPILDDASQLGVNRGAGDILDVIGGAGPGAARAPDHPRHGIAVAEGRRSAIDNVFDFGSPMPAAAGAEPVEDSPDGAWWLDDNSKPQASGSKSAKPSIPRPGERPVEPRPQPLSQSQSRQPEPGSRSAPNAPRPGDVTLEEVLRGAGLDPTRAFMAPEVAQQLGELLRLVVAGTMEVLKARNDIRRELRIPSTQLAPVKNNPLKFSADVDDALHRLFVQRSAAYLDTVSAFREAFDDIRHHQVALLKSVGVAFDHMLAKFDPKELEKQMHLEPGRSGVLGLGGAKVRPWEAYAQLYAELLSDHDHTYRRLFGEVWARAYETELRSPERNRSDEESP